MENPTYWTEFWTDYGRTVREKDEQTQVLRTSNKKPISAELWNFTLDGIVKQIELSDHDEVLELCCGNGLISRHIAESGQNVTAVDISEDLLQNLRDYDNITTQQGDIRQIDFETDRFSKIVLYAGIQYLTWGESVSVFQKVFKWLKPDGIFFVGDIPDAARKWHFYDSPEREATYFDNLSLGKAIVGTWFDQDFLEKLGAYTGFSKSIHIPQHRDLIYSSFRYDFKFVK